MKTLEELGISPAPWELMDDETVVVTPIDRENDIYGEVAVCQGGAADKANARFIAAHNRVARAAANGKEADNG